MRQETELIIQLTSQSVEELTADGQLEFDRMEKLINELQSVMNNELQHCTESTHHALVKLQHTHKHPHFTFNFKLNTD